MTAPNLRTVTGLSEFLQRLSYKPGWKIKLIEQRDLADSFDVVVMFPGYDSDNAAFEPLCIESEKVQRAREIMSRSIGKAVRHGNNFYFRHRFYLMDIERMRPEDIIKHVIGRTIKEAELWEFDRWFKYEGQRVFDEQPEFDSRRFVQTHTFR